jgi:uncharacterized membrane protein
VFALTFFVIGGIWIGHPRLFGQIKRADMGLLTVNLVFLATIALLPFPSSVLGRYGSQPEALFLYAATMIAVSGLLGALTLTAAHRRLLAPSTGPGVVRRSLWRSATVTTIFAVSIPVALVSPGAAPWVWAAILPVRLLARVRAAAHRHRPEHEA